MNQKFEAQEIWGGASFFRDTLGQLFGVATHGTASGNVIEFWAFKSGSRLTSSQVGVVGAVATELEQTSLPGSMTSWDDETNFKSWAASEIGTASLDYFKHKVTSI